MVIRICMFGVVVYIRLVRLKMVNFIRYDECVLMCSNIVLMVVVVIIDLIRYRVVI